MAFSLHAKLAPLCLWFAQATSVLGCIAFPACFPYTLSQLQKGGFLDDLPGIYVVIPFLAAFAGFCFSYAMAVVFAHARARCAELAVAERRRLGKL